MKRQLRHHIAALCLLAPAAATFTALPTAAIAQSATPEVYSLHVDSDNGINPGSRLHFRLEGTPQARAFVRLQGVRGPIPLREVSRGVYVGNYTVARSDQIDTGDQIRAILRSGNRTVTANYDVPPGLRDVAAAPQLRIDRFDVSSLERPEPGADINFVLDGAPGGQAWVDLPGAGRVRLHEERPGHYEGRYTIRRADRFDQRGPVVANLRAGDRIVSTNLGRPLFVAAAQPANVPLVILNQSNNAQIDGNVGHVRGRTAPFATVDVRVDAVPPVVGQFGVAKELLQRQIQADASGNFEFTFNSPFPVPGTRYDVQLVAHKADVTNEARLTLFQRQG